MVTIEAFHKATKFLAEAAQLPSHNAVVPSWIQLMDMIIKAGSKGVSTQIVEAELGLTQGTISNIDKRIGHRYVHKDERWEGLGWYRIEKDFENKRRYRYFATPLGKKVFAQVLEILNGNYLKEHGTGEDT